MKKIFYLIFLSFFFLSSFAYSQQQGLGIVFNETPISKTQAKPAGDNPLTQFPPVCGKKRRAEGFSLPYPFGASLYGMWYQQQFIAGNLLIADSTGKITVTSDSMTQSTTAGEFKLSLRPDFWLLPFLNVYGIFGYTEGKVNPDLQISSFTMYIEGLPGGIPIDTAFTLTDELTYHGPTVGAGITFAVGFDAFFVIVDYNYSVTYPNDQDGKLVNHALSPKFGVQFSSKNGNGRASIWIGGLYLTNNQSFKGTLNVEEISPVLALILGKEAGYSGDIRAKQEWNMLVGAGYFINKHHSFLFEGGFIGRQQLSLGYGFHF
ncbi:MAG: hypothetical protein L3J31_06015 [Bacteroidales bacterium]|nr:hypothetical protein [Bacteroidales bacterium]